MTPILVRHSVKLRFDSSFDPDTHPLDPLDLYSSTPREVRDFVNKQKPKFGFSRNKKLHPDQFGELASLSLSLDPSHRRGNDLPPVRESAEAAREKYLKIALNYKRVRKNRILLADSSKNYANGYQQARRVGRA